MGARELADVALQLSITLKKSWRTGEVMENTRSPQRLEEGQCYSHLQKGQERGPGKPPASQPHLRPWKGDRIGHFVCHCQACRREEGHQE